MSSSPCRLLRTTNVTISHLSLTVRVIVHGMSVCQSGYLLLIKGKVIPRRTCHSVFVNPHLHMHYCSWYVMSVCPSVRPFVCLSVCLSVCLLSTVFLKHRGSSGLQTWTCYEVGCIDSKIRFRSAEAQESW